MLRIGLLGTGYWAAQTHAAGLVNHPQAEFVGVWGRNPVKTAEFANRFGVRAYKEVEDLLADVDAVSVALPPDIQADLAHRAAESGRHLLLDKPVALSVAAADRIAAAVDKRQLASLVFVTRRYHPAIEAFIENAAQTGGWHSGRVVHCSTIDGSPNPYAASHWRQAKGGLWDIGPHALSLLVPVLGPVVNVTAVAGPCSTHHLILRHSDQGVSSLTLSTDTPPAAAEWSACFVGRSGVLAVPRDDGLSAVDAFRAAVRRLARNVSEGVADDPLSIHSGRHVVAILAAAEESAAQGVSVDL